MPKKRFQFLQIHFYTYRYLLIVYFERTKTRYTAMAFVPPIIFFWKKDQLNNTLIYKHECIHHRQMLELLILPFYIWYISEYLIHRIKGKKHQEAYHAISFEREAYYGEKIKNYASKPQWFGFLKFLLK